MAASSDVVTTVVLVLDVNVRPDVVVVVTMEVVRG